MKTTQLSAVRCLLFGVTLLAACAQPDADVIARELFGSWQTDAPEYAERGFVLTADSITLHQGGGIRVRYPIEGIRRDERNGYVDYTVTYRGIVSPLDFRVQYRMEDGAADLRFPNQQRVIWKRVTSGDPQPGALGGG